MNKYSILLVVLGSLLWGTDSLFRRPLSQHFSPVTIVFLEHCVLALVVLPFVLNARQEILKLNKKDWTSLIFIAVGGSVAATSLFTYAIKYGNPSVTVLLQKTQPLFTILLARWLLLEKPHRWFWWYLFPALGGAYLVSTPNWKAGVSLDPLLPRTLLAALGAASMWGASTVFGRYIVGRISILPLTGLRFIIALPVLATMFWFQAPEQRSVPTSFHPAATLTTMALIPGLLALIFYYKGLQSTIASLASVAELTFPITAVVTNWYLLNIRLSFSQLAGAAVLVASVTALSYRDSRDKGNVEKD